VEGGCCGGWKPRCGDAGVGGRMMGMGCVWGFSRRRGQGECALLRAIECKGFIGLSDVENFEDIHISVFVIHGRIDPLLDH